MNILHVGYTKSGDDFKRVIKVFKLLKDKDVDTKNIQSFFIDLNDGEDFFLVQKQYDIIVLHFIYRGDGGRKIPDLPMFKLPELKFSDRASWFNWKTKLEKLAKKYVFAFGGIGEVGGSYLCNLNGFKGEEIEEDFWVFERA